MRSTALLRSAVMLLAVASPLLAMLPQQRQRQLPVLPQISEEEELAQENARTHVLQSTHVPDRREAIGSAREGRAGRAALEEALKSSTAEAETELAGRGPGGRGAHGSGPDGSGKSAIARREANWVDGYLVDGLNPDIYAKTGKFAVRLRTASVVINPGYTLKDMATRSVLRLKAGLADQLLRLTINAPPPKSGNADAYLITLAMAVGWSKPETPPVAIFFDGKLLEYDITRAGIQLVKRMTPGPHHLTVQVEPGFEGDIFEFHYAMVNRL